MACIGPCPGWIQGVKGGGCLVTATSYYLTALYLPGPQGWTDRGDVGQFVGASGHRDIVETKFTWN